MRIHLARCSAVSGRQLTGLGRSGAGGLPFGRLGWFIFFELSAPVLPQNSRLKPHNRRSGIVFGKLYRHSVLMWKSLACSGILSKPLLIFLVTTYSIKLATAAIFSHYLLHLLSLYCSATNNKTVTNKQFIS
jgi:hypothetical protein